MKYCSMFRFHKNDDEYYIKGRLQFNTLELFERALPEIEDDRYYSIRLKRVVRSEKYYDKNVYEIMLEIEPIPVNYAVYVPPKEIYLKPTESLLEKLRNCWRYLKDQDGGRWDYREARK